MTVPFFSLALSSMSLSPFTLQIMSFDQPSGLQVASWLKMVLVDFCFVMVTTVLLSISAHARFRTTDVLLMFLALWCPPW